MREMRGALPHGPSYRAHPFSRIRRIWIWAIASLHLPLNIRLPLFATWERSGRCLE